MTQIVIAPGAWSTETHWQDVIGRFQKKGFPTTFVHYPTNNPTYENYAQALIGAIQKSPSDCIVVTHSMSGMLTPMIATQPKVRHICHFSSYLPKKGESMLDQARVMAPGSLDGAFIASANYSIFTLDPTKIGSRFFNSLKFEAIKNLAIKGLVPQPSAPMKVKVGEMSQTSKMTYFVCALDKIISPTSQKAIAAMHGIRVKELPNADHFPSLSCPEALVDGVIESASLKVNSKKRSLLERCVHHHRESLPH